MFLILKKNTHTWYSLRFSKSKGPFFAFLGLTILPGVNPEVVGCSTPFVPPSDCSPSESEVISSFVAFEECLKLLFFVKSNRTFQGSFLVCVSIRFLQIQIISDTFENLYQLEILKKKKRFQLTRLWCALSGKLPSTESMRSFHSSWLAISRAPDSIPYCLFPSGCRH